MPRLCFALDLQGDPELIAEYERYHKPGAVWPEIISDIREEGYQEIQIWRTGDRMFMIAEVTDDFPRNRRSAETQAKVGQWDKLMEKFQRLLPNAPENMRWVPMGCVFDLSEH